MKKNKIFIILIFLIIISIFVIKLDFLFFKVKLCNKTQNNMYVEFIEYQKDYLLEIYSYIFWNNYDYKTVIIFWNLKPNECSNYKKIHRSSNYLYITWLIYKKIDWINYPYKLYETTYIDTLWNEKKDFWKYIYNIIWTKNINNTFKGDLYIEVEK